MENRDYELLVQALWLKVARLEPNSNEIAVGGIRHGVDVEDGKPVLASHVRLRERLIEAIKKRGN